MFRTMNPWDSTPAGSRTVSRRAVLVGSGAAALGGVGLLTVSTEPVSAEVTMGAFSLVGDAAEVSGPPASITVSATGEYQVTAASVPDRVDTNLQVRVGTEPLVDSIATASDTGVTSGVIDLSGDIYSHKDLSRGFFMPTESGETKTTPVTVRIVARVVNDGTLVAEAWAEDTADLTLTDQGVLVELGGDGTLVINE